MTNFSRPAPVAFGDIQGCHAAYRRLADKLAPSADTPLWFAGDLVNRGPASLATLREIAALGERAVAVLGNHDLHLLAVAAGIRSPKPGDTIGEILDAPDADALLEWVRHRPFAHFEQGMLMVHAGVLPQWDATLTLELADELQRALRAPNWRDTLCELYGNEPNQWRPDLKRKERQRVAFNAFTRIRFCTAEGAMEFRSNGGPSSAPDGYLPWFDVPGRKTAEVTVVFGHWAALGLMLRDNLVGLDSGCVWGNRLSAVRLTHDPSAREVMQVACERSSAAKE
ncbi:bis(5'-nucleosyl)-tetraphosphatase (symmetrical) [Burkholderia singularis]|uniref:Bis(5'-nucleosyl)-tetraphosphatase, symmetrical n=2 Tax=Burkholderia TaxID=32008 RepID=A0A124P853_9BURK|nr:MULTISPECIES: symmetrical bis(5'-nucleosyl)-tetraphosphatase [Burkholderia]AEO78240.1 diadenosine tetraphosphatase [Burkholderia sp. MSMB175]AOK28961.1 bis(5'-nucleosyl)-tetraphosphatase (symmetrical) [Burkholderia sp. Bp7605]KVE24307.1 bis(5'-nucleosyl)-tetraphosphatase (symmetrical) [Burkholderia singularis]